VLYVQSLRSGEPLPIPYFIPGLPSTIPTFGTIHVPGQPPVNRDSEFRWGIWANVAGLVIAAIAFAVGFSDTHVLTQQAATIAFGSNLNLVPLQVPIGLQYLIQTFLHPPSQDVIVLSPLVYAGWFCFLISLANIVPSRLLDGGRTASSLLSARNLSIAVMVSLFVVVFVNFWMALFIFAVSWGAREIPILDRTSKPSGTNIYIYAALMGLAAVIYLVFLYPPLY
jgi:membrane-associated protease RseP (regulator of RpoE activity)